MMLCRRVICKFSNPLMVDSIVSYMYNISRCYRLFFRRVYVCSDCGVFPAAGQRNYNSGSFTNSGNGYYWSSSPYASGHNNGGILYFYNGNLNTRNNNNRSNGNSVRCVSELMESYPVF